VLDGKDDVRRGGRKDGEEVRVRRQGEGEVYM
jgi:hypothetical protein